MVARWVGLAGAGACAADGREGGRHRRASDTPSIWQLRMQILAISGSFLHALANLDTPGQRRDNLEVAKHTLLQPARSCARQIRPHALHPFITIKGGNQWPGVPADALV